MNPHCSHLPYQLEVALGHQWIPHDQSDSFGPHQSVSDKGQSSLRQTCRDSRRVIDQTDLTDGLRGRPKTDGRHLLSDRGGFPVHTMDSTWSLEINEDVIVKIHDIVANYCR